MLAKTHIAFLGAGNMAEALVSGMIQSGLTQPSNIFATDVATSRLDVFSQRFDVHVGKDNQQAVEWADILVLCVKPQIMNEVLDGMNVPSSKKLLVISIAAGYPISRVIAHLTKNLSVIRAMPNTPALVREGAIALACGPGVSEHDFQVARRIFEAVGRVVVTEEYLMDAVTGLSGSGPAYIALIIESLSDAGVKMGLSRQVALSLSIQTVLGTAKMVLESGDHPAVLKDRVTSPGGTTIAGLHQLEKGKLRATLMNAVEAATKRSQELGQ